MTITIECPTTAAKIVHNGHCCGKWTCACDKDITFKFQIVKAHLDNEHKNAQHDTDEHNEYGMCEFCELCKILDDMPIQCPMGHSTGRQYPKYEESGATVGFFCEICQKEYSPLTDTYPDLGIKSAELTAEEWELIINGINYGYCLDSADKHKLFMAVQSIKSQIRKK